MADGYESVWGRELLEASLCRRMPEEYEMVRSWPEHVQESFYELLDRRLAAAIDRAILFGSTAAATSRLYGLAFGAITYEEHANEEGER